MDHEKTAKTELTPDKIVSRKLFKSMLIIVFSLFCMTYSAWAMFADSARETTHTLSAANFHISIAYPDSSGATINPGNVSIVTPGEYEITLTASGSTAERSGYAKIILGDDPEDNENIWYTQQMLPAGSGGDLPDEVVFTLTIPENAGSVPLSIASTWATLAATSDSEYKMLSDKAKIEYQPPEITDSKTSDKTEETKSEETEETKSEETTKEETEETTAPKETEETTAPTADPGSED